MKTSRVARTLDQIIKWRGELRMNRATTGQNPLAGHWRNERKITVSSLRLSSPAIPSRMPTWSGIKGRLGMALGSITPKQKLTMVA